eukprot:tig00000178_g12812.t1
MVASVGPTALRSKASEQRAYTRLRLAACRRAPISSSPHKGFFGVPVHLGAAETRRLHCWNLLVIPDRTVCGTPWGTPLNFCPPLSSAANPMVPARS